MRVIEAAGGLVRRRVAGGVEVVLVHRPAYDDWTLPIGRVEPGESLEACAVREVAEETGLQCRLVGFLDTLTVDAEDGWHRFHVYEMEPVAGAFAANPETDRADWLPIDEAVAVATHANVRELLAAAARRFARKEIAGRVLLCSELGRVLLVGSRNPEPGGPTVWVAPGGTAEAGETPRQAAARELLEEVGIDVAADELVGPIGTAEGPSRYVEYFLLAAEDGLLPTVHNPDAAERAVWVGFRWWTPDEIERTDEVVWPVELATVLRERAGLHRRAEPLVFAWGAKPLRPPPAPT